mmetsp:Transcript_40401/g.104778  ORF Transcript_40401/g.104778 Transcript_40401/m.104778 type:complete len:83 (-) Transcript_40401:11-259(-)
MSKMKGEITSFPPLLLSLFALLFAALSHLADVSLLLLFPSLVLTTLSCFHLLFPSTFQLQAGRQAGRQHKNRRGRQKEKGER